MHIILVQKQKLSGVPMSIEELTIEKMQQKDLRLNECIFQRLGELPDQAQVSIQVACTGETKFGLTDANEKILLATLKLEMTMTLQSINGIQTAIAKVVVAMQGVFSFSSEVEIVSTLKASPATVQAASDRLMPTALQYLKRVCIDAGLPSFSLPMNMAELSKHLSTTKTLAA